MSVPPYNVGSDEAISIAKLADMVESALHGNRPVFTMINSTGASRYVPKIDFSRENLGLSGEIGVADAICKTLPWVRTCPDILHMENNPL